jgi:hypothetical protein
LSNFGEQGGDEHDATVNLFNAETARAFCSNREGQGAFQFCHL